MKNILKSLAAAVLVVTLAGCGSAAPVALDMADANAIAQTFQNGGFEIEDVQNEDDQSQFKIVSEQGGANVRIDRYDDLSDAIDGWDATKAAMTQSDYYMLSEKENGMGSVAIFNNSINYIYAIVAFDAQTNTVTVVSEISKTNMDLVRDVLVAYGFDFQ